MTDTTTPVDDDLPRYTGPPLDNPPATSWSNGRIAAMLFGVAALVAGVFFAVMAAGGGGDGPEAAVDRLFDAIGNEDVLGVLESLDPEERKAVQPGLTAIVEELERLGVLSPDLDLNDVAGVDMEFSDLEYRTATLSDDLVAVTLVGGTVTTTATPADVPVGPVLEGAGLADAEPVAETEVMVETADDEVTFVAIRRGGGWYVSVGYSIAEAIRAGEGFPFPDPAAGVQPDGADSPSAAVEELLSSFTTFDVERMIALTPPGEMDVLHHFAPVFLPDAEAAAAELARTGIGIGFRDLELVEHPDGDATRIEIANVVVEVTSPAGEHLTVRWDGECTTFEGGLPSLDVGPESFTFLGTPGSNQVCTSDLADGGPFMLFAMPQTALTSFTTVEVDGEWYVSPTRTTLDLVVQMLRLIEDDGIQRFVEEGFGALFGMSTEYGSEEVLEFGEPTTGGEVIELTPPDDSLSYPVAAEDACFAAMDEWGRRAAELEAQGGDPSTLPPFPPPECQ